MLDGAIYGLASHGRFLGAFKPGNRSREVAGLYLAGGAAHPGPGMPMVLMSGWIAADALDADGVAPRAQVGVTERRSAMSDRPADPEVVRRYSPRLAGWFAAWLEGYLRRAFDGVRVARAGCRPRCRMARCSCTPTTHRGGTRSTSC